MSAHDPRILARWRTIIAELCRSPLTIAAFCRVRKLCKSNFYRWRNSPMVETSSEHELRCRRPFAG